MRYGGLLGAEAVKRCFPSAANQLYDPAVYSRRSLLQSYAWNLPTMGSLMRGRFGRFSRCFDTLKILNNGPDDGDHSVAHNGKPLEEGILGQAVHLRGHDETEALYTTSVPYAMSKMLRVIHRIIGKEMKRPKKIIAQVCV